MGSEDRESRNVEKDQGDLSIRRRSKSNESYLIVRTTSDPDLYSRGRFVFENICWKKLSCNTLELSKRLLLHRLLAIDFPI